jgi:hypothetical protein
MIQELFNAINEHAKWEQDQKVKRDAERLKIEQQEEEERQDLVAKINGFFNPLYGPYLYVVDISQYQVLDYYPYLYIYSAGEGDISIWGSNIELNHFQDVPAQDLLENWKYDFVKALFQNLDKILLELAIKSGYLDV